MTVLFPYGRYGLTPRLGVWAAGMDGFSLTAALQGSASPPAEATAWWSLAPENDLSGMVEQVMVDVLCQVAQRLRCVPTLSQSPLRGAFFKTPELGSRWMKGPLSTTPACCVGGLAPT